MHKNQISVKKILSEVRSVLKRRVRLSLFEEIFDEAKSLDIIVPEQIEQLLFQREYNKLSLPEVILTKKPIIGNLFFIHLQSHKVTLCSINDWESYSPPSIRSFLLYTGIRTLLHFKFSADSHYSTRSCILDRCKSKIDIKHYLNPDRIKTIFCDECYHKYPHINRLIHKEITILNQWVELDYKEFATSIEKYITIDRPAIDESLQDIKRLQRIELLSNLKIDLFPSRRVYSYLTQYVNDINEIFEYLKDNDLEDRIKISRGE